MNTSSSTQQPPGANLIDPECFLCEPDPTLVYSANDQAFALVGLGPIVDDYTVLATQGHFRSMADIPVAQLPRFAESKRRIRTYLEQKHGHCLITEHGRVPVCAPTKANADPHCYHAHLLLFPGIEDITTEAAKNFKTVSTVTTLPEAMAIARNCEEYLLISPSPQKFSILTRPGTLIRQFTRTLVADSIGRPDMANWRKYPDFERASRMAEILRQTLGKSEK